MRATLNGNNVIISCPDCNGAITTYEVQSGGRDFGHIHRDYIHEFKSGKYDYIQYFLMRCASCGRGGLAVIHGPENTVSNPKILETMFPYSTEVAILPANIPSGIVSEFREAETCASFGAWRAASALLRSSLEKTLNVNGYRKNKLYNNIEDAAADGILTEARRRRAHEEIRVLGNDVLHDEWREVDEEEVDLAHHYAQRILEDFYDDREAVEPVLITKNRITKPKAVI